MPRCRAVNSRHPGRKRLETAVCTLSAEIAAIHPDPLIAGFLVAAFQGLTAPNLVEEIQIERNQTPFGDLAVTHPENTYRLPFDF